MFQELGSKDACGIEERDTGGVIAVMIGGFTALLSLMIYLYSDTKAEMNRRFTEMNQRFEKIEQLLLRLRENIGKERLLF